MKRIISHVLYCQNLYGHTEFEQLNKPIVVYKINVPKIKNRITLQFKDSHLGILGKFMFSVDLLVGCWIRKDRMRLISNLFV